MKHILQENATQYNELISNKVCILFSVSHDGNKQSKPSVTVFGDARCVTSNILQSIDGFLETNTTMVTLC